MHCLVLGINYWPEETGIGVFNTGHCEYLAAQGHQVTMCTAFPYYPQWRLPDAYRGRLFAREVRNHVTILRSYLYVPRRVTSVRRILHEASFIASSCLRMLGGKKPDLLFVVSPPLGFGMSAAVLTCLWKIPYVFHVEDLQPDAALDLGMLPAGRLTTFLYAVERCAYRQATLVTTLTEGMRQRIVSKGIQPEKVVRFDHWADPAFFTVPLAEGGDAFRRSAGFDNRFLVVHAGNMGIKQGLEVILGAAERSREDAGITYLLVGDGAARPALEARAKTLGLANIYFLPLQPRDTFLQLLAAADVCLVTQQRTVADIVFPSKMLTLFAAGRPVVASLNLGSEVARVITEAEAGVVVAPEDPTALLEAILTLRKDRGRLRVMGEQGRTYARKHWDYAHILPAMEARLLQIAAKR